MKPAPEIRAPRFHPKFRQLIPSMIEDIAKVRNDIGPIADSAGSLLSQISSYLEFEIDKLVVAIQKAEWEAQADLVGIKARRDELESFKTWMDEFEINEFVGMLSVVGEALTEMGKEHPP